MSVYNAYVSTDHMSTYSLMHGGSDTSHIIVGGKVVQDAEAIDTFTFDIYPNNEHFTLFGGSSPYNVFCKVTGTGGEVEFEGRVISVDYNMTDTGLIYKKVVCEGLEALLRDVYIDNTSILIPGGTDTYDGTSSGTMVPMSDGSFRVNPAWYFKKVLSLYNAQAPTWAQVVIGDYYVERYGGEGTLKDEVIRNDNYYASPTYGTSAYDVIGDIMGAERADIDENWVTYDPNVERISLVVSRNASGRLECNVIGFNHSDAGVGIGWGHVLDLTGRSNKRVISYSNAPDYTEVVTAVTLLGPEKTTDVDYTLTDSDWTIGIEPGSYVYEKPSRMRLPEVMEAVNGGWDKAIKYFTVDGDTLVYNRSAETYGRITRPLVVDRFYHEDEDGQKYLTQRDGLNTLRAAMNYLIAHSGPVEAASITAYAGCDVDGDTSTAPKLYQWWFIDAKRIDEDGGGYMMAAPVVRKTIDMDNPPASSVELGQRALRETEIEARQAKKQKREQASTENPQKDSSGTAQDDYAMAGVSEKKAVASGGGSSPLLLPFNVSILQGLSGYMKSSGGGSLDLSSAFKINRYSMTQVEVTFCLQHIIDTVAPGYIPVTPWEMMSGGITREVVDKYAEYGLFRVDRVYGNARYGTDVDIQRSASKRFVLTDITASAVRDSGREYIMDLKWEYVDPPFTSQTKLMRKMIGEGKTEAGDIYYEYAALRWVKLTIDIGTRMRGDVTGKKLSDMMDIRAHGFFVDPREPMQATNSSGAYVVHKATALQSVIQGEFKFWKAGYLDDLLHNNGGYSTFSTSQTFVGDLLTIG